MAAPFKIKGTEQGKNAPIPQIWVNSAWLDYSLPSPSRTAKIKEYLSPYYKRIKMK
jgi:hypothetical protein